MRSRRPVALAALALAPFAFACSDGGSPTSASTTPGQTESAFDEVFSLSGGRSQNDSAATGGETCTGESCPTDPSDPTPEPDPAPVCEAALPVPAGALAVCQTFCAKLTGCLGEPAAAAGCAADCASTLAGTELAAVAEVFGCFTAASCDDLAAWQGGEPDTTEPTEPGEPTDAGSGAAGAAPRRDGEDDGNGSEADPLPPREVEVASNPIGECLEAVFLGWTTAPISAAKQAVCDAVPANEDRCAGEDDVAVGSGSASSGSSEPDATDPAPPREGGGEAPGDDASPVPPEGDGGGGSDDGSDEDVLMCHAYGALLSGATFTRLGACDALADCAAREACLQGIMACAPFIEVLAFGYGASSSGTTVDVIEPEPGPPPTPAEPPAPR